MLIGCICSKMQINVSVSLKEDYDIVRKFWVREKIKYLYKETSQFNYQQFRLHLDLHKKQFHTNKQKVYDFGEKYLTTTK